MLDAGYMTQYIDLPSKQQYIYYMTTYRLNQTTSSNIQYSTYVQSDIFDANFNQYKGINSPLNVTDANYNASYFGNMFGNGVCTSPKTNDILTCWLAGGPSNDLIYMNIACRIYFVSTNAFSDVILTTNSTHGVNVNEIYGGLLCFDDSYFIPYFYENIVSNNEDIEVVYGTLLDLKGTIKWGSVPLGINRTTGFSGFYLSTQLMAMKGSKQFDINSIDSSASDAFVLSYQIIDPPPMKNIIDLCLVHCI